MRTLNIASPAGKSQVHFIVKHPLEDMISFILKKMKKKPIVITDEAIKRLYAPEGTFLGYDLISFGAGETFKTRKTKEEVENALIEKGCNQDYCIIALGGGVVNDLVGFVAATFYRGVPWIYIPTTFLSVVDACIGGKTGVNTAYGKNLIGTFYPPVHVLIDPRFLSTLSEKQWRNGMAEVIKHSLIASPSLFKELQKVHYPIAKESLMPIIYKNLAIKTSIVKKDPLEQKKYRRILNFGHTIAHAIETLENFQIDHGEAVALGILAESYLSTQFGLPYSEFDEIHSLIESFKFPLTLSQKYPLDMWDAVLSKDKKTKGGQPRFVLLKKIGKPLKFDGEYCSLVTPQALDATLEWLQHTIIKVAS